MMRFHMDMPQTLSGTFPEQLQKLWKYLYVLAERLNLAADAAAGEKTTETPQNGADTAGRVSARQMRETVRKIGKKTLCGSFYAAEGSTYTSETLKDMDKYSVVSVVINYLPIIGVVQTVGNVVYLTASFDGGHLVLLWTAGEGTGTLTVVGNTTGYTNLTAIYGII